MASLHRRYADQVSRLERQQGWLIDLQRLLQPAPDPAASLPRAQDIETQVDRYLVKLSEGSPLDETDRALAQHLVTTFRNRWWGLFVCYDVSGLPATNNDLEGFFGRLKTNGGLPGARVSTVLFCGTEPMLLWLTYPSPKLICWSDCAKLTGSLINENGDNSNAF